MMNYRTHPRRQRGATLIVGLIMLVLITLMMVTAFMLSSSNLKSVGNMQYRVEATAAANSAIEQVISSAAIFIAPAARTVVVGPYTVVVAAPRCLYTAPVLIPPSGGSADPNSIILDVGSTGALQIVPGFLDTYWDIAATVQDGLTGASVESHQGVRVRLPDSPNPCPA